MGGMRSLCEAIILQSLEDVLGRQSIKENRKFLTGEGMDICASIAELSNEDRGRLLELIHVNDVALTGAGPSSRPALSA